MSNTIYIKQSDGTYKKVSYIEKNVKGNLSLIEDVLPKGEIGATGSPGEPGLHGLNGVDGLPGRDGKDGLDGKNGINGLDGYSPIKNVDYFDGLQGEQGPQGFQGEIGPQGEKGDKGDKGETGPIGPMGPVGPQGIQGPQGVQGIPGPVGPQGLKGDIGPRGFIGPQGEIGATGATGPRGLPGKDGKNGFPGAPGAPGPQGPQGIPGPTGPAGGGTFSGLTYQQFVGTFSGSSMVLGPPLYYDVVFSSPLTSDYIVTIESDSPRDWTITNKTDNGFRVDSNSTTALDDIVYWKASEMISGDLGALVGATGATGPGLTSDDSKGGVITGVSFSGTLLSYTITFAAPYSSNYTLSVIGEDVRTWSISNKTLNGFTIHSNSSEVLSGDVYWTTIRII